MTETELSLILNKIERALTQEEYSKFYEYFSYLKSLDISSDKKDIYELLEMYFGRTFNPIEYEIINSWEDNELTRYAIKETILRRIYNVKYINTIITNYKKQNITTVQEAKMAEERFLNSKKKQIMQNYVDVDKVYKEFTEGKW